MNVGLEQVAALKYATTQLEATHALVTLAISLLQTTKHAVVCGIFVHVNYMELFNVTNAMQ